MGDGSVNIKVRPLRIGILVDPSDRAGLKEAIEINSVLWGGVYNPIIPFFGRTPKNWEPRRMGWRHKPKPIDIVAGYLDGFDPDFVLPIGKCLGREFNVGNRETLTPNDILEGTAKEGTPKYGIGIIDLLKDFVDKELKFTRTEPIELLFPNYPRSYGLFLSSVFGILPFDLQRIVNKYFAPYLSSTTYNFTIKNYINLISPTHIYPRKLTSWLLNRPLREPQLFVCDAKSTLDIIDYWNLRAAGYYIIPIPIQAKEVESVKESAKKFIEENYGPYKHNPNHYHSTTIQKSRSLNEDVVTDFLNSLKIEKETKRNGSKYILRWWYPRLWESWARDNTDENIVFPYSHEVERQIAKDVTTLEFRSEDPKISLSQRLTGFAKFANEFSFHFFSSKEPMASVFPEGSRKLSSAIGHIHFREWRFSKAGPTFLAQNKKDLIFIELPTAESVMTEWFRERGWKVELSGPGRIAKQLIQQLGGNWGISLLAHEGIIKLFDKLQSEKGSTRQAVIGYLNKIKKEDKVPFGADYFLERLLEVQALRLGAKIQCPVCTRYNWVELDKLDYVLHCRFCLSEYDAPVKSPKDISWTYRTHGPFTLTSAQGAFTVLLTLNFLEGSHQREITPLFSYKAENENTLIEADLSCLYRTSTWRDSQTYVIHAECKSTNRFERVDINRMRVLRDSFLGSTLIFATLNRTLNSQEIEALSSFVLTERRKEFRGKPYSPIIVLTGNELFSIRGAPSCWKNMGGIYDKFSEAYLDLSNLKVLADVTQQLYLEQSSWHDWYEGEIAKKSRLKKAPKKKRTK